METNLSNLQLLERQKLKIDFSLYEIYVSQKRKLRLSLSLSKYRSGLNILFGYIALCLRDILSSRPLYPHHPQNFQTDGSATREPPTRTDAISNQNFSLCSCIRTTTKSVLSVSFTWTHVSATRPSKMRVFTFLHARNHQDRGQHNQKMALQWKKVHRWLHPCDKENGNRLKLCKIRAILFLLFLLAK